MRVLVGCGRDDVQTSPSTSLVVMRDPFNPNVSLVSKLSSACIINESCQNISISYRLIRCTNITVKQSNPNSTLPDSIWSPSGFTDATASSRSKVLHTQENRVNSTCLCQYNKINCHQSTMTHNHNQMPNSIIIWITCKKVSSKNKFT